MQFTNEEASLLCWLLKVEYLENQPDLAKAAIMEKIGQRLSKEQRLGTTEHEAAVKSRDPELYRTIIHIVKFVPDVRTYNADGYGSIIPPNITPWNDENRFKHLKEELESLSEGGLLLEVIEYYEQVSNNKSLTKNKFRTLKAAERSGRLRQDDSKTLNMLREMPKNVQLLNNFYYTFPVLSYCLALSTEPMMKLFLKSTIGAPLMNVLDTMKELPRITLIPFVRNRELINKTLDQFLLSSYLEDKKLIDELHRAIRQDNSIVLKVFLERGYKPIITNIRSAAVNGSIECLKVLLDEKMFPDLSGVASLTISQHVSKHPECFKLLYRCYKGRVLPFHYRSVLQGQNTELFYFLWHEAPTRGRAYDVAEIRRILSFVLYIVYKDTNELIKFLYETYADDERVCNIFEEFSVGHNVLPEVKEYIKTLINSE